MKGKEEEEGKNKGGEDKPVVNPLEDKESVLNLTLVPTCWLTTAAAVLKGEEEEGGKNKGGEDKPVVNPLEDKESFLNFSHWCQPAD